MTLGIVSLCREASNSVLFHWSPLLKKIQRGDEFSSLESFLGIFSHHLQFPCLFPLSTGSAHVFHVTNRFCFLNGRGSLVTREASSHLEFRIYFSPYNLMTDSWCFMSLFLMSIHSQANWWHAPLIPTPATRADSYTWCDIAPTQPTLAFTLDISHAVGSHQWCKAKLLFRRKGPGSKG